MQHLMVQSLFRTTLRFDIIKTEMINICIYNSTGQLVKVVYNGKIDPGNFEIKWDGLNENGLSVPSGIYFANLRTNEATNIIKMMILK